MKQCRLTNTADRRHPGFTLPELMLAASLGVLLTIVAGDALLSHMRSNARAESLQRQRDDWTRATSFIESEVAMSERVFSSAAEVSIPTSCGLSDSQFRMALDLKRDLPLVIYGVKPVSELPEAERLGWVGTRVLVRCGPDLKISADGSNDYQQGLGVSSVLLDGLDAEAPGEGLSVSAATAKSVSFTLAVKGLVSSRYSFGSGTYSRINPVAGFPEDLSTCDRVCSIINGVMTCRDIGGFFILKGNYDTADTISIPFEAISNNDNVTVCGLGGGDTINGSAVNDVLDAGRFSSATGTTAGAYLNGGGGRNFLFGTPGNDTLLGGPNDDTLVGRGGNDLMQGGGGNNAYSPWPDLSSTGPLGNVTVNGGDGLDVVYIRGNRSSFGDLSSCRQSGCTITHSTGSLTLDQVNVLIFKDGRVDLP